MNIPSLRVEKETLFLGGNIDFYTVTSILQRGLMLMEPLKSVTIDLRGLLQSDSSALALLVAWFRFAKQQDKKITFVQMPLYLKDIAKVCGLEGVLPVVWEN